MIKIDLLKNHPEAIPTLANIWHEVLGKIWTQDMSAKHLITIFADHLNNENLPITFVALDGDVPVGMCSLCKNDGIRHDLGPWLADVVVAPKHQKQGIGKMLVKAAIRKVKDLGFEKLYLFTLDPTIPEYYEGFGWKKIAMDEFKSHPVTVMEVEL